MLEISQNNELPSIPDRRYFTIGEVSTLCDVKTHVLRYWEQEFKELSPVKRRGNRRYYQQKDIHLIRQIKSLLYAQGFTISGAKSKLGNSDSSDVKDKKIAELEVIIEELRGVIRDLAI